MGTATWRILYTCWDYGAIGAAAAIKRPPSLRAINIDRGSLLGWGCVRNCGVTAVLNFTNCPSLYCARSLHLRVETDRRDSGSWIFPTLLPLRLQLEIHQVEDKLLGKQKFGVCSLHVWLNLQLTAYQLFCPRAVSLWADSTGCYLIQLKSSQSVHTAPSLPFQTISSCLSLWDTVYIACPEGVLPSSFFLWIRETNNSPKLRRKPDFSKWASFSSCLKYMLWKETGLLATLWKESEGLCCAGK